LIEVPTIISPSHEFLGKAGKIGDWQMPSLDAIDSTECRKSANTSLEAL